MTLHTPETLALFRRLVEQEITCSEQLGECLAAEQSALGTRDPDTLLDSVQRKQGLVRALEQSVAAHNGFLTARRLPQGRAGTEMFLKGLPDNAAEHLLWQRLQDLAARCRDHNQANGSLVALSRVRTQHALEILRGGGRDSAKTYGRAGNTHGGNQQRFLASA